MVDVINQIISGSNKFSKAVDNIRGHYNYGIAGTWVGTVTLQRSFDEGTTWRDVDSHTANVETYGYEPGENVYYRCGFKTGEYTSGQATVRIDGVGK
jgi:hypothetical protein